VSDPDDTCISIEWHWEDVAIAEADQARPWTEFTEWVEKQIRFSEAEIVEET
jgi:hypothetical protein